MDVTVVRDALPALALMALALGALWTVARGRADRRARAGAPLLAHAAESALVVEVQDKQRAGH